MFSLLLNLRKEKKASDHFFPFFLLRPAVHVNEGDVQEESDAAKCIGVRFNSLFSATISCLHVTLKRQQPRALE